MSDWIEFYDFKHSVIYVNARHREVHYRTIAEDIRKLVSSPTAHVLDYGCGEATSADLIAASCAQLILVEAAPNVRASLTMRYAGHPKIVVISAEQAAALPTASFDLVVIGAYPPDGTYNLCRGDNPAERDKALTMIPKVPLPDSDPVLGKNGPLAKLWHR